jgi:hypothetical protein
MFRGREGGVVSLEPQPFLQCHPSAPKTQWVMVAALWYRRSDWLEPLRLLRGRFEGKGAVGRRSSFPVADSEETTPPSRPQRVFGCGDRPALGEGNQMNSWVWNDSGRPLHRVAGFALMRDGRHILNDTLHNLSVTQPCPRGCGHKAGIR